MIQYLTSHIPGTGGIFKAAPEDFLVEEIPLYPACGTGEHTYVLLEKRGITTLEALRRLGSELGISDRDMGFAGMKDAVGITRQTISIPRIEPERLNGLELPGFRIHSAVRHTNKLKLGHLAGNRFHILVREVHNDALQRAESVLDQLTTRGVPNYFGSQRYGIQGNSHLVGRAILRGDIRTAVQTIIGDPEAVRDERWRTAITAFRRGDLAESLRLFPGHCRTEREIVQRLLKHPDAWDKALRVVHPRLVRLYLSAAQSALFDQIVAQRLHHLDRLEQGDLAIKHQNGACFLVADPAMEQHRAQSFEVSASGPLFGSSMKLPEGDPLHRELAILEREGLRLQDFALPGTLRMEGERRPLRVPLGNPQASISEQGMTLTFSLPRGSYATAVLREVVKADLPVPS